MESIVWKCYFIVLIYIFLIKKVIKYLFMFVSYLKSFCINFVVGILRGFNPLVLLPRVIIWTLAFLTVGSFIVYSVSFVFCYLFSSEYKRLYSMCLSCFSLQLSDNVGDFQWFLYSCFCVWNEEERSPTSIPNSPFPGSFPSGCHP